MAQICPHSGSLTLRQIQSHKYRSTTHGFDEGRGPVNPELLFLIDYVPPSMICIIAYNISVSDGKQEDPEFLRVIAQESDDHHTHSIFKIDHIAL